MKLTALVPLPHGLHHLKIGDDFEEPDQTRANMLIYLQRAKAADVKPKMTPVAPPVEPPAPVAPVIETKVEEAEQPSGDVSPLSTETTPITKRTYTRRDLTAQK